MTAAGLLLGDLSVITAFKRDKLPERSSQKNAAGDF
jgi:hypothetical protein